MPWFPPMVMAMTCDPLAQARLDLAADGVPDGGALLFVGHLGGAEKVYVTTRTKGEPETVQALRTYTYGEDCTLWAREEPPPGTLRDVRKREARPEIGALASASCGPAAAARTAIGWVEPGLRSFRTAIVLPDEKGWVVQVLNTPFDNDGTPPNLLATELRLDSSCALVTVAARTISLPVTGAVYAANEYGTGQARPEWP